MSFEESIINGSFNNIINNIMAEGMDYIIPQENILYQVTTTDNQKNNNGNISTINFGNCERTLKNKYNINISLPLIILKIDYFIPGILISLIEYEVFHPLNKSKLDLSYCKNEVNLYIPVKIDENKIYQYNPNNAYYKMNVPLILLKMELISFYMIEKRNLLIIIILCVKRIVFIKIMILILKE